MSKCKKNYKYFGQHKCNFELKKLPKILCENDAKTKYIYLAIFE